MKTLKLIAFILVALVGTNVAFAKCGTNGIFCLSQRPTLNKNGLIVLEFYSLSQPLVADLNGKYPVYLKSSDKKVQLNVVEILKGEMWVTQVVLKPATGLLVGKRYSLEIANLPKYEDGPRTYNDSTKKLEPLSFKITDTVDNEIPVLNGSPKIDKETFIQYGCGPETFVYFNLSGQDKSELFARATVKNKTTGLSTTYILRIEDGLAKVGHGMCSGAFLFKDGENFEVTFQLFDQSGNVSAATQAISFTKPEPAAET
ncbi:hypothetical protein [Pinibacter aurantiacus]|uniref:Uncharacterized protein n=1 Tax=Pinibacter aurantiacus TaxID=2851599 RepID=A0A9E2SBZ7_9BACT|nr:hypothetical protein [Pinibacter aurantiacus]MBV4357590.1 hypothetical protein [Pinibacter aurantiacus]